MMASNLTPGVVDIIEKAIDDKISKAQNSARMDSTATQVAQITKVDADGTAWCQLPGATQSTPIRYANANFSVGDLITVSIAGGSITSWGNISSPATTAEVLQNVIEKMIAQQRIEQTKNNKAVQTSIKDVRSLAAAARKGADDAATLAQSASDASTAAIHAASIGTNQNESPFYSWPSGSTRYWSSSAYPYMSSELRNVGVDPIGYMLSEGWGHLDMDCSLEAFTERYPDSSAYANFFTQPNSYLETGTEYTMLVEVANLSLSGDGAYLKLRPVTSSTTSSRNPQFENVDDVDVSEGGVYRIPMTTKPSFDGCNKMVDGYFYTHSGMSASFDVRISLYKGDYEGGYKPYVDASDVLVGSSHFWHDSSGAHVGQVERMAGVAGAGYNMTLGTTGSTAGIVLQNNADLLASFTPTALNFYRNGLVNSAYTDKGALLGKDGKLQTVLGGSSLTFLDGSLNITDYASGSLSDDAINQHILALFNTSGAIVGNPLQLHSTMTNNSFSISDTYNTFFRVGRTYTSNTRTDIFQNISNSSSSYVFDTSYPATSGITVTLKGHLWKNAYGYNSGNTDVFAIDSEITYNLASNKKTFTLNATRIKNDISQFDSTFSTSDYPYRQWWIEIKYTTNQYPSTSMTLGFEGDYSNTILYNRLRLKGRETVDLTFDVGSSAEGNNCVARALWGYPSNNVYGLDLYMGSGGRIYVGSGESSYNAREVNLGNPGSEEAYILSDSFIDFVSNANGVTTATDGSKFFSAHHIMRFTAGGILQVPGIEARSLELNHSSISNVSPNDASRVGGYIDFHHNRSTADFTTRLSESGSYGLILTTHENLGVISPEFRIQGNSYDLTASNNGVTSNVYPNFRFVDKNNRVFARIEGILLNNGNTGSYWYVNNWNTSTGTATGIQGIRMELTKTGTLTYSVSSNSAFRNALGASSGVWPASLGGTGNNSLQATRNAMGLGNTTGALPVANGGTGQTGVTTTTGTNAITMNSNCTLTTCNVYTWGKLVTVFLDFTVKAAISVPANGNITDIAVGTLATGLRPATTVSAISPYDAGWASITNSGTMTLCRLEATGAARTVAAGQRFRLMSTYLRP